MTKGMKMSEMSEQEQAEVAAGIKDGTILVTLSDKAKIADLEALLRGAQESLRMYGEELDRYVRREISLDAEREECAKIVEAEFSKCAGKEFFGIEAVANAISAIRDRKTRGMKTTVVFYCGSEIVLEGATVVPDKGDVVRINGKNYITTKQHFICDEFHCTVEVGIILAELSPRWLDKLINNEKEAVT